MSLTEAIHKADQRQQVLGERYPLDDACRIVGQAGITAIKKSNLFKLPFAALFLFIQIGCERDNPAAVPRNSQPVVPSNSQPIVEDISDKTLENGDSTTVKVRIEDEDEDDIHTINATCEDQGVALSSIEDESITIRAIGVGETTCTVYATDSSGQDNSKSESVTFQITVTAPPISLGKCQVGMKVQSGESCFYSARDLTVTFSVRPEGLACRESDKPYTKTTEVFGISTTVTLRELCVSGYDIRGDDAFDTNFSADQNSDGSWTIKVVPQSFDSGWTNDIDPDDIDSSDESCQIPPLDQNFEGVPAIFIDRKSASVLLSDGEFAVFVHAQEPLPILAFGGQVQSGTKFPIEYVGVDIGESPDGRITGDEVSISTIEDGEIDLRGNRSSIRVRFPEQDVLLAGLTTLSGLRMNGDLSVTCGLEHLDSELIGRLVRIAKDLIDLKEKDLIDFWD